jgi:hypothetical protein
MTRTSRRRRAASNPERRLGGRVSTLGSRVHAAAWGLGWDCQLRLLALPPLEKVAGGRAATGAMHGLSMAGVRRRIW